MKGSAFLLSLLAVAACLSTAAKAQDADCLDRTKMEIGTVDTRTLLAKYVRSFNATDDELYTNAVPNAATEAFLLDNCPRFTCPDRDIERTYYFRWWTFRKHLKRTDAGDVITEFLPRVPWAGACNTISCPLGHHIREGRWLGGGAWARSHLRFMVKGGGLVGPSAYVNWPARVAADLEEVTGDTAFTDSLLPDLVRHQDDWERGWTCNGFAFGLTNGLFHAWDNKEGMEFSASTYGARPIVNAAFVANARAISRIARRCGRTALADDFAARAAALAANLRKGLWNAELGFFTTRLPDGSCCTSRELCGYAPWYFGLDDVTRGCGSAWSQVVDERGFRGAWGLTSLERRSPLYRIDYVGHECKWNGPVWPYDTSIALSGLADCLHRGGGASVSRADFVALLHQYAAAHVRVREDGVRVPWIDENQGPDDGDWISRTIILKTEKMRCAYPRERGKDYNHSTFCDLVISGLVGFVPDGERGFAVDPLFPPTWDCLLLENLHCRGRVVSVRWRRDEGLTVEVDGTTVAHRKTLGRLDITWKSERKEGKK